MDLHRSYAEEFGIGEAELETTTPSPTTRAYTDFLVRTAALGTFGDTVAALLPCMWGFNETGTRLAASGESDDERYATWIDMYSGEEFTELTDWCKGLMNDVATNATESDRERYRELFVTSARYEYRFWDAAWLRRRGRCDRHVRCVRDRSDRRAIHRLAASAIGTGLDRRRRTHRFVHELADGTVDDAVFRRYLVQDYAFCGRSPACSATRSVKRRLWTPRPR